MRLLDKSLLLEAMIVHCDFTMLTESKIGKSILLLFYTHSINSDIFRDIYHAPRMQHVMTVVWSLDNKYVLSGSDEFNLRLWKAYASEKLGPVCFKVL
jgi:WD40 repeat protein